MTNSDPTQAISLEQALADLDAIVTNMEKGDLSLEDSLHQFERGIQLMRFCQKTLASAEQKIQILLANGTLGPFNPQEEESMPQGQ